MRLPRLQLFEFNDLPWVPEWVRDTIVESLSRALGWGRMLGGLVPPFEAFLAASGGTEVLDIGAGAGGPARVLAREISRAGHRSPRFLLTDLHPREQLWRVARDEQPEAIDYVATSVDATEIDPLLSKGRVRSIINVFHHFDPKLAQSVLVDAVKGAQGVFIAEAFARNPLQFVNFAPAGLLALMVNPLLSPKQRIQKALFTWCTPFALAISLWDGLTSTLRVYDEAQLRAMVEGLGEGWTWTYGRYRYPPCGTGYYFYGVPPR